MLLPFLSHLLCLCNAGSDPEIENFIAGVSIDLFSYLHALDGKCGTLRWRLRPSIEGMLFVELLLFGLSKFKIKWLWLRFVYALNKLCESSETPFRWVSLCVKQFHGKTNSRDREKARSVL